MNDSKGEERMVPSDSAHGMSATDLTERPDLEDVRHRATRLQRKRRAGVAVMAVAAVALAVPVGAAIRPQSAPDRVAQIPSASDAAGSRAEPTGAPSFIRPACTVIPEVPRAQRAAGVSAANVEGPAHELAVQIDNLGRSKYAAAYGGVSVCESESRVDVYRTPDARFDAQVEALARSLGVRAVFGVAAFSRADSARVSKEIVQLKDELRAQGVQVSSISLRPNGTVEVRVRSDVTKARNALSKYADRVDVRYTTEGPPEPLA
ncbi:MAG: hypothetical protein ACT4P1_04175 [Sporichthyaceae bacterium]